MIQRIHEEVIRKRQRSVIWIQFHANTCCLLQIVAHFNSQPNASKQSMIAFEMMIILLSTHKTKGIVR